MIRLSDELLGWYRANKRDLPWRHTSDPYAIMVSEVMLQQTRVDTVIPYYINFLDRFPNVDSLAEAEEDEVLNLWKGLGYYSRGRNLHKAAKKIMTEHDGVFPQSLAQVRKLPGVGEYTAGAIMSIAFNQSCPAVDGNVLRVIARICGISDDITLHDTKDRITTIVREMMPEGHASDFTQALMELGAMVCTPKSPECGVCPASVDCWAFQNQQVHRLPVKKKKEKPAAQRFFALLLVHQQKLLLTRNHPGTLLKNLWGVPLIEAGEETPASLGEFSVPGLEQMILKETGIQPHQIRHVGKVRHVFTHRIWEMEVLYCSQCTFDAVNPIYQWVNLEDISSLPIPSAFARVIEFLEPGFKHAGDGS